nr:hypothetical protein [Tanacetum cinerariifolium]
MDLSKLIINDDMIDYVFEKYENNCQLDDAIGDEILGDLLKREREREKQQRVKGRGLRMLENITGIKILDDMEQMIENVGKHLNKAKEKMDLNKRKEKMVMEKEKYENNCQLDDAIGDEILSDLLKREREKQQRVKGIKILDDMEQMIENVGKHLNKAKEKMDLNKRKEKMVMEKKGIIIESDISSDHNPFQVTYNESSDDNPFQISTDEIFDHNPFQVTSDESTDDTLKSSSKDICSSDATWEHKSF